jgi:TMEM70/TMEM186/TMEM223 protein family
MENVLPGVSNIELHALDTPHIVKLPRPVAMWRARPVVRGATLVARSRVSSPGVCSWRNLRGVFATQMAPTGRVFEPAHSGARALAAQPNKKRRHGRRKRKAAAGAAGTKVSPLNQHAETEGGEEPETRGGEPVVLFNSEQKVQFGGMAAISVVQMVAFSISADTVFWYAPWEHDTRFAVVYGLLGAGLSVWAALTYYRKSYVGRLAVRKTPEGGKDVILTTYSFFGNLTNEIRIPISEVGNFRDGRTAGGRFLTFKREGYRGRYLLDINNGIIPDYARLQQFLDRVQ